MPSRMRIKSSLLSEITREERESAAAWTETFVGRCCNTIPAQRHAATVARANRGASTASMIHNATG